MTEIRTLLPYSRGCFGCGEDNSFGVKLKLYIENEAIVGDFTPQKEHQGYEGVTHGGIISTLLDEAMAWTPKLIGADTCVTAELTIRFIKPIEIGMPVVVRAWIENNKKVIYYVCANIKDKDGNIMASAKGRMIKYPTEKSEELYKSFVSR